MFDTFHRKIVVVEKKRPKWQLGRLNGPGGKIELTDASPEAAMAREFYEECCQQIDTTRWAHVCTMTFLRDDEIALVYVLTTDTDDDYLEDGTDEHVLWYDVDHLFKIRHHPVAIHNLAWLVAMCSDDRKLPAPEITYDMRTGDEPR